jgi:tetratricopeptide (TPR) repeat protein
MHPSPSPALNFDEMPVMAGLFASFRQQFKVLGLLTASMQSHGKNITEQVIERAGPLRSIFEFAEMATGRAICGENDAFLFNNAMWPSAGRLAGYTSSDQIPFSASMLSYVETWDMQMRREDDPGGARRAALWYGQQCGNFRSALEMLFDLYECGYCVNYDAFLWAAMRIADACVRVSDSKAFFLSISLADMTATNETYAKMEEIAKEEPQNDRILAILQWASERAHAKIVRVRQSANCDEWLIGNAELLPLCAFIAAVNETYASAFSPPATLRTVLHSLDEIRADTGGYFRLFHRLEKVTHLPTSSIAFWGIYRSKFDTEWLDRIMQDRLLIPSALTNQIRSLPRLEDAHDAVWPRRWRYYSEVIAWPLAILREFQPELFRTSAVSFADDDPAAQKQQIIEELTSGLKRALANSSHDENIQPLVELKEKYPWSMLVRRELGIQYDECGRHAEAIEELTSAVLLNPDESESWHELAVALRRKGTLDDGNFCYCVRDMIRSSK